MVFRALCNLLIKSMILVSMTIGAVYFAPSRSNAQESNEISEEQLLKRGQRMFLRCRTCHTLEKGGKHGTGPNLNGIFGAKSASREDFKYSPALMQANIVWSAETIDQWMSKPRDFVRGTSMAFVGLKKEADRKALIAYLAEHTK